MQKEDISEEESPKNLLRIEKLIWIWAGGLTFVFIFAWPLLTLPAGIFSKVLTPCLVHRAITIHRSPASPYPLPLDCTH